MAPSFRLENAATSGFGSPAERANLVSASESAVPAQARWKIAARAGSALYCSVALETDLERSVLEPESHTDPFSGTGAASLARGLFSAVSGAVGGASRRSRRRGL